MIKRVETKDNLNGRYLVNLHNIDLEVADANARGISVEKLIDKLSKDVKEYLFYALWEIEK